MTTKAEPIDITQHTAAICEAVGDAWLVAEVKLRGVHPRDMRPDQPEEFFPGREA